ncbi:MAG: hypothetical protein QM398_07425, partial [Thermoproteota archaeon]|nr:hypothetical protein [Thermoproteota archaeon]
IHERYLFPAISMLALMFPFIKRTRLIFAGLTCTLLVNQAYVLAYLNSGTFIAQGDPVVLVVSAFNLIMFMYASLLMWSEIKGKQLLKPELDINQKEPEGESKNEP